VVIRIALIALVLVAAAAGPVNAQAKPAHAAKPGAPRPRNVATKPAAGKAAAAAAKPSGPPSVDSLAAITRRGHALMERDSIACLGGDAMAALSFPPDSVRRLVTRQTRQGWEVAVGTLSEDGRAFLISRVATPGIQKGLWASSEYESPESDSGYFADAARAIETSLAMFRPAAHRPYVAMAIPTDDGPWWVYVYPAATQEGVYPRGGDMRFRVSSDGRVIIESRRLHESITEFSVRTARSASSPPENESLVSGDTPEDTDVFHVLQRRPALPELMRAGRYLYRIDVDGSIRLLPN
jgi:hypothetical protein